MSGEFSGSTNRTFELGGARFEVMTAVRDGLDSGTMWVRGLHWPGCCECEGTHVPIGFGEGRFGGTFRVANADFWKGAGVDAGLVEAEMNRWLAAGDVPDWVDESTE